MEAAGVFISRKFLAGEGIGAGHIAGGDGQGERLTTVCLNGIFQLLDVNEAVLVHDTFNIYVGVVCCKPHSNAIRICADGQRTRDKLCFPGIFIHVICSYVPLIVLNIDSAVFFVLGVAIMTNQLNFGYAFIARIDKRLIHIVSGVKANNIISTLIIVDIVGAHCSSVTSKRAKWI